MENLWWNIFILKIEIKRKVENINNKMNKTEMEKKIKNIILNEKYLLKLIFRGIVYSV